MKFKQNQLIEKFTAKNGITVKLVKFIVGVLVLVTLASPYTLTCEEEILNCLFKVFVVTL